MTAGPAGPGPREEVGPLADEAARLLRALHETFGGEGHVHPAGAAGEAVGAPAPDGPECQICPICQLLATVRRTRPEVFDHLSDAVRSLLAAAREVVATPLAGERDAPAAGSRGAQAVQRIDVH